MHTGNIWINNSHPVFRTVYPCAYREHTIKTRRRFCSVGLSLCIQGTLLILSYKSRLYRFIPVHTGNMIVTTSFVSLYPVYPCAYREHISIKKHISGAYGLSLCIQGTFIAKPPKMDNPRFIPVHTGNMI